MQKSINRFTECIDPNIESKDEAIKIVQRVDIVLKAHETYFVSIFEEFFIDLHLFEFIGQPILNAISSMVGNW